jgi:hypothetical protein
MKSALHNLLEAFPELQRLIDRTHPPLSTNEGLLIIKSALPKIESALSELKVVQGLSPIPLRSYMVGTALTTATVDVLTERRRQISVEGWTPEHDDEHVSDELAALAAFYAMPPAARDWDASSTGYGPRLGDAILPCDWEANGKERRQELVIAAALILAEIERIDRAIAKARNAREEARA